MNTEMIQAMLRSVPYVLVGCAGIWICMGTMMEARRPLWIAVALGLAKSVWAQLITQLLVEAAPEKYTNLPLINAIVFPLWGIVLVCYFMKGNMAKVLLGSELCEVTGAAFSIVSLFLCNLVGGRANVGDLGVTFQWTDLLIFPIWAVLFGLFYWKARPLLLRYRTYEVRHKRLVLAAFGTFILFCTMTYFPSIRDAKGLVLGCYSYILFWVVTFAMIVLLVMRKYRREIYMEQNFLRVRQEQMMAHYTAMKMTRLDGFGRLLAEQMEELEKQEDAAARSERMQQYLTQLREEYDSIRAGVYCDDLMVDSVLYCQAQRLKKQGMDLQCYCQGYARGAIDEQDMAELLMQLLAMCSRLLKEEMPAQRSIDLRLTTVKDRLLIAVTLPGKLSGWRRGPRMAWLQPYLRKYDGMMRAERERGQCRLLIGLALRA